MNLPLHYHADAVHAFQKLEDPAQGWPLRRLMHLIRYRCIVVGSWLPQAALRQRIHQHSPRHHHQSPLHPTGFFAEQRRDKKHGGFEPAAPALDAGLGFIGPAHLRIAPVAGWNMGTNDKAGALLLVGLNDLLRGSDLGVPLPRQRLEGTRGGGPPLACLAFMGDAPAGVDLLRAPRFGERLQRGLRRLRRLKTLGRQVPQWLCDGVPFTLRRFGATRRGALHGSL